MTHSALDLASGAVEDFDIVLAEGSFDLSGSVHGDGNQPLVLRPKRRLHVQEPASGEYYVAGGRRCTAITERQFAGHVFSRGLESKAR